MMTISMLDSLDFQNEVLIDHLIIIRRVYVHGILWAIAIRYP